MPEIARFYGIVIKMYFTQKDHNPPHIHALYGETMAAIEIKTLKILEGDLPKKALELVLEWVELYQNDLLRIWETQEFIQLPPLV